VAIFGPKKYSLTQCSPDNDSYVDVFMACQKFDTGVSAGRYEVSKYLSAAGYTPNKLERYLSTGQIDNRL
jgi:hypothetical protein